MLSINCDQPMRMRARIIKLYNKKTDKSIHVFSVFERIEPDMQENTAKDVFYRAEKHDEGNEKVIYKECWYDMPPAFLVDPMAHFDVPDDKNPTDKFDFINSSFKSVPQGDASYLLTENLMSSSGINGFLPNTEETPTWVKTYIDEKREVEKYLVSNNKLWRQLEEVSKEKMGVELSIYREHIGNVIVMWHHPDFRRITFSGITKPQNGIVMKIDFRNDKRPPIKVNVCQFEQGDCVVNAQSFLYETTGFLQVVPLPYQHHKLSIQVYDDMGNIIYYCHSIGFSNNIDWDICIPSTKISDLQIENRDGKKARLEPAQKWTHNTTHMCICVDNGEEYYSIANKRRDVAKMEATGAFVFFDGDRGKREKNRAKAIEIVQMLLNKAKERCYICDYYFGVNEFADFVYHIKNEDVEIRILSSTNMKMEAKRLSQAIDSYNLLIGKDVVKCKMLSGKKTVLHDRFIASDEMIWSIGASFNELGKRASVIYKIHPQLGVAIIGQIEEWWNDDKISKDIHGY